MSILRHYGFGASFRQWMIMLYNSPRAKILYYVSELSVFNMERGTCQGCPLSPLFDLALEPLAEAVCSHPDIRDMDVAVKNPYSQTIFCWLKISRRISLPNLSRLETFASLSGLHVKPCQIQPLSINRFESSLPISLALLLALSGNSSYLNIWGDCSMLIFHPCSQACLILYAVLLVPLTIVRVWYNNCNSFFLCISRNCFISFESCWF